jgi:predicted RNase H-like HicB family nuclease
VTAEPLKYEVVIYWSRDDEAFLAEVPELPGCAADGTTPQEALANVHVVAQEWIETARELVDRSLSRRGGCSSRRIVRDRHSGITARAG